MRRDAHGLVERGVGVPWVALLGIAGVFLSFGPVIVLTVGFTPHPVSGPPWALAAWSAAALFGLVGVALVWLDRVPPVVEVRVDRSGVRVERRSFLGRTVVHYPASDVEIDVHTLLDGRSCLRIRAHGGRSWTLGLGEDPERLASTAADVRRLWAASTGSPDEVPDPLRRLLRGRAARERR